MAGESRFTKRYTTEQKQALMRAVFIDGQQIAEAVRMAARGDLGIPAFTIDRFYAYSLIRKHRETFELEHPEALAKAIDRELTRLAALALKQARTVAKSDKPDPEAIKRSAATLASVKRALGEQAKPKPKEGKVSNQRATTDETAPANRDVIRTLLANAPKPTNRTQNANESAGTASISRASNGADPG